MAPVDRREPPRLMGEHPECPQRVLQQILPAERRGTPGDEVVKS